MATNYFIISFSIKYDDDYNERRSSMLEAIRSHGKTYEDTTSFIILETESTQPSVEISLIGSKINSTKDKYVIVKCLISTFAKYGQADELVFT